MTDSFPPDLAQYEAFLSTSKNQIRVAQAKAEIEVNKEMVLLYWQIGQEILHRQQIEGCEAKVIERLAKDLKREFPDIEGVSRTNLLYMRAFAEAYPKEEFVHQLGGRISWKHTCVLLERVKNPDQRTWYIQQTLENGWSCAVLEMQIESRLYERQRGSVTKFAQTKLKPQSDLAQRSLQDSYRFDFLNLGREAQEPNLEQMLVHHIRDFLLELEVGFSFAGSQYPIEIEGKKYQLGLLFYHLKLRCFVIIDLKMVEFQSEFFDQMNFYVSAVNATLKQPDDQPTIGIILCRSKNKMAAKLALQGMTQPIDISTHKIVSSIPEQLKCILLTVKQLEMALEHVVEEIQEQGQEESNNK